MAEQAGVNESVAVAAGIAGGRCQTHIIRGYWLSLSPHYRVVAALLEL